MSTMRAICNRLRRDRRAIAAVEMAIVSAGLLVPLTAFTVEAAQAMLTQYKLSRALHAGLANAWGTPSTASTTAIQNAAIAGFQNSSAGTYGSATMTPAPVATLLYYCIDPTVGIYTTAPVAAGSTCSGSLVLATWAKLSLTASIPTLFPLYKGSANWALSLSGAVRIQ